MTLDISLSRSGRESGWVRPDHVALALLGFAVALTVFLLFPPFLGGQVGPTAGFTGQEAADLLTPIVAMALLALAIERTGAATTGSRIVFVAFVALWVAGQGIHLAANALGDMFEQGAARDAFYATPVGTLDHWLDEFLSHWLWHVGWVGLLGVLLVVGARATGAPPASAGTMTLATVAGALHGFTWFVVTDEGETWALAIPATAVLLLAAFLVRGRDGAARVVTRFLIVGGIVTLVLYAAWIVIAGWEPKSIIDWFGL